MAKSTKSPKTKAPVKKVKQIGKYISAEDDIPFQVYIWKVLKQVHPDTGISMAAMLSINRITNIVGRKIAGHAAKLSENKSISAKNVQNAVRIMYPGDLAKHAVSEGTKTVTKFAAEPKGTRGEGMKKSFAVRSGLQVSPARVKKFFDLYDKRVATIAYVYLAAVIEYTIAELLEIAGNVARDNKRVRIVPQHFIIGVSNDPELMCFFGKLGIDYGVKFRTKEDLSEMYAPKKGAKKPKRANPNKVAFRHVKNMQLSSDFVFQRSPFGKLARSMANDFKEDTRMTGRSVDLLQVTIESELVKLLDNANRIALLAKRKRVSAKDINLARGIMSGHRDDNCN